MKTGTVIGIVICALLVWGFWSLGANGIHVETGHGIHTGYITAVEQNGLLYPSWSAYVKTDTQSSQEDLYCVEPQLAEVMQQMSQAKAHVTVEYVSYIAKGLKMCNGEPSGVITGVKVDN